MGGTTFAVSSSDVYSNNYTYKAFDNSKYDTYWHGNAHGDTFHYVRFYNPQPLKVTLLTMSNRNNNPTYSAKTGIIRGSKDGNTWYDITQFNTNVINPSMDWDIDLSSNKRFFKYYEIYITASGSDSQYSSISNIQITATYISGSNIQVDEAWVSNAESSYFIKY